MTSTFNPAAITAWTSRCPGSETVGNPASETSAITSPCRMRSNSSGMRLPSLCSFRLRSGKCRPWCCSSRTECRVSSQATAAAVLRLSTPRREKSPRFPMGVATSRSAPWVGLVSEVCSGAVMGKELGFDCKRQQHFPVTSPRSIGSPFGRQSALPRRPAPVFGSAGSSYPARLPKRRPADRSAVSCRWHLPP